MKYSIKNLPLVLMIAVFISLGASVYFGEIHSDLKENLIRLHIRANSDSDTDQKIKLVVRDAIISDMTEYVSPEETAAKAEKTALNVLRENGFLYGASGQFCEEYFPVRHYKDLTLPAGKYRAVEIILGEGKGHNWWCVLYPPICAGDENGKGAKAREQLKESLDPDSYDIITNNGKIKIKFRSVEAAKKVIGSLKKLMGFS